MYVSEEQNRNDKLFLFYRQLARAGIYVDLLYLGTEHHALVNAVGYNGSDSVPAVQTKLGPSINFTSRLQGECAWMVKWIRKKSWQL